MTKKELIKALETVPDDAAIICQDESGGWDNIQEVIFNGGACSIVFGGGSPFSDE